MPTLLMRHKASQRGRSCLEVDEFEPLFFVPATAQLARSRSSAWGPLACPTRPSGTRYSSLQHPKRSVLPARECARMSYGSAQGRRASPSAPSRAPYAQPIEATRRRRDLDHHQQGLSILAQHGWGRSSSPSRRSALHVEDDAAGPWPDSKFEKPTRLPRCAPASAWKASASRPLSHLIEKK